VAGDSLGWMLFVAILLDGLGLPLAAELVLIGAGAAARAGLVDPGGAFAVAMTATLAGHCAAYWAGRVIGPRVRPTATRFTPGRITLLGSRFLVGVRVVLCPLAGLSGVRFGTFVLLDVVGAGVWVSVFMLLGYASGTYSDFVRQALEVDRMAVLIAAAGLVVALAVPVVVRHARLSVRAI